MTAQLTLSILADAEREQTRNANAGQAWKFAPWEVIHRGQDR